MITIERQRGSWCFVRCSNASWRALRRAFPSASVETDRTVCVKLATNDDVARLEAVMAEGADGA